MISQIAADEFTRRLPIARQFVAAGKWSADQADRELKKWLAIALHAGATPDCVANLLRETIAAGLPESVARDCLARDFAAPHEWRAELARARDVALAENSASWTATSLAILAIYLGAPPIELPTERKAA